MSYFEGADMKRVEPKLKSGEMEIVAVFREGNKFGDNEDQQFFWLRNNEQVLKPKSAVRGLLVYEFVCPCHDDMVYLDTGKTCCLILNDGNNHYGFWTGEDVAI